MNYVYAFLFSGIVCALGQIILDNTKLTPGHITSLFTVAGALLSFLGCYDYFVAQCGAGATLLISNFGHMLYSAAYQGYLEEGILGISRRRHFRYILGNVYQIFASDYRRNYFFLYFCYYF